jgi:hypothetical protein
MGLVDEYRHYAAECLALAQQRAKTPQDRARLLEMAHAWTEMAAKVAERSGESPQDKDSSQNSD